MMSLNWRAAWVRVRGTVGVAVNWDIAGSSLSWARKFAERAGAFAGISVFVVGWEREAAPGRGGASHSMAVSAMGVSGWVEANADHPLESFVASGAAAGG